MNISTEFDFRTDANGKDPDSASPTLQAYHEYLWSKPLPSGIKFQLRRDPGKYLIHESELGRFQLSSDTIVNSMRRHRRLAGVISQIPTSDLDRFQALGATVGARLIFPGNKVDGKQTLNVARGFNSRIADRIDWSLECIRLHYRGLPSPLSKDLARYGDFFELFGNFKGYVDFFLLNDIASEDSVYPLVAGQAPFGKPRPNTVESYREYMESSVRFVLARNLRIADWASRNQSSNP